MRLTGRPWPRRLAGTAVSGFGQHVSLPPACRSPLAARGTRARGSPGPAGRRLRSASCLDGVQLKSTTLLSQLRSARSANRVYIRVITNRLWCFNVQADLGSFAALHTLIQPQRKHLRPNPLPRARCTPTVLSTASYATPELVAARRKTGPAAAIAGRRLRPECLGWQIAALERAFARQQRTLASGSRQSRLETS